MTMRKISKSRLKPRAPRKADFDSEDQVLREIARELDIDRDELDIRFGSPPNGYGEAYTISIHGGHKEWIVMRNDDEFDDAFMMGDRYGTVAKIGKSKIHVKMDKSGKTRLVLPNNLQHMEELGSI